MFRVLAHFRPYYTLNIPTDMCVAALLCESQLIPSSYPINTISTYTRRCTQIQFYLLLILSDTHSFGSVRAHPILKHKRTTFYTYAHTHKYERNT